MTKKIVDVKKFIMRQHTQRLERLRQWEAKIGKRCDFLDRVEMIGWSFEELSNTRPQSHGWFRLMAPDGRVFERVSSRTIHRIIDAELRRDAFAQTAA